MLRLRVEGTEVRDFWPKVAKTVMQKVSCIRVIVAVVNSRDVPRKPTA